MTFNNNTCNHCGWDIVWWNPKTGNPEKHPKSGNNRPFNPYWSRQAPDHLKGELHLCMEHGQNEYYQDGKKIFDKREDLRGYFYTTP